MFHALSRDDLRRIVDIQLALIAERLEKRDLSLEVTDAAKLRLAELGFDPVFGARPLKRVLQKEVTDRIARAALAGRFQKGDSIAVDVHDGAITVTDGTYPEAIAPRGTA
jgi:ATP-dependent Clp protease ATP-binding subunit ClpB